MSTNANNCCYKKRRKTYICQGDILREFDISITSKISGTAEFLLTPSFSYSIVLSQDCDLEQHYKLLEDNISLTEEEKRHDKIIETILICPAFPVEKFVLGNHVPDKKMHDFDGPKGQTKALKKLMNNDEFSRYHFLKKDEGNFPELVIDFKRFYTVPIGIFDKNLKKVYITSTKDLYKERISQRFTNYLSRIGLPDGESI